MKNSVENSYALVESMRFCDEEFPVKRMHLFCHCVMLLTALLAQAGFAGETDATVPIETAVAIEATAAKPARVAVFYLTNRASDGDGTDTREYNGDRGLPGFGHCDVEFTPIPIVSEVATDLPFYLKRETNVVTTVELPDREQFWKQLGTAVKGTSSGSVVLFIHGYNYGFERTCRMAAELQRTLHGKATVVAFSWPSNGLPSDYVSDLADVEWSVPLLSGFIRQLAERFGGANLQVVAHSLGSRGAIFALRNLAAEQIKPPVIEELVLLAPDFDSQTFVDLLPGIRGMTGHMTLYASANDTPLKLSEQLSGYPRLGQGEEHLTVIEGVETIDISSAGRYQITGHEYFFFHPQIADDLAMLLSGGVRASGRSGLVSKTRDGLTFWVIQ